jgi:parallel beta-helix repeat protein
VSFELVEGVDLLGHFAGFEASPDERDLANANYETILDGLIYPENDGRVTYVIKGQSIHNSTIIDGLTIQKARYDGVYLYDCNTIISNCKIRDNYSNGLNFNWRQWCTVKNNIISNNGYNGINLSGDCAATIIDNWIHNNSVSGILSNSSSAATIRNNTIYGNATYGIQLNWGASPIIRNCIIRENSYDDLSSNISNVNYCCLQTEHSGTGNIWGDANDPCFVNPNPPYDLHIKWNSPCRNKGDSNGIPPDETDIDGEGRIKYGRVDIGADEYYRSPDFDKNGIVDFKDFAVLALTWLKENGDGGFNEICDLADDDIIDVSDLKLFCQDWLLQTGEAQGLMFGGEGGEEMMMENNEALLAESILTEADVKEILEWTDAIEAEIEGSAEGRSSAGEYAIFRQALEEDLLRMLKSSTDEK